MRIKDRIIEKIDEIGEYLKDKFDKLVGVKNGDKGEW